MRIKSQRLNKVSDPGIIEELTAIHKNINDTQRFAIRLVRNKTKATFDDYVLACKHAIAIDIVLSSLQIKDGFKLIIKDISGAASSNTITVKPIPGGKIDGSTDAQTITADFGVLRLFYFSNEWYTW